MLQNLSMNLTRYEGRINQTAKFYPKIFRMDLSGQMGKINGGGLAPMAYEMSEMRL